MKLFKQESDRLNDKGKPFDDLFLGWVYDGKTYVVKVQPRFACDYSLLFSVAEELPKGEIVAKYL